MAAGRVLLQVTGLLAGSVMVDFRLLVLPALDVRDMAAAFLAAFRNQTLLEVAGEDTFIGGTCNPWVGEDTVVGYMDPWVLVLSRSLLSTPLGTGS